MSSRLRDWMIVGVVLALVFGVALQAPREGKRESRADRSVSAPAPPPGFRRPPRSIGPMPVLPIDPRPMILYTR